MHSYICGTLFPKCLNIKDVCPILNVYSFIQTNVEHIFEKSYLRLRQHLRRPTGATLKSKSKVQLSIPVVCPTCSGCCLYSFVHLITESIYLSCWDAGPFQNQAATFCTTSFGTFWRFRTLWSSSSYGCSMGDTSGQWEGQSNDWTLLVAKTPRQTLATCGPGPHCLVGD